ncbi:MAG TPA: DUF1631 domain-containing protein [Gammaproteobacteria bacterium]|nr:DUF1631 domain-containing protein [Gammaproteobacteria bacterium]
MAASPQFRPLLESCLEMAFSHLRPLMERLFENADVALLDFAEKAESNTAQTVFFEAMNAVRRRRKAIEKTFFLELKRSFTEFPVQPAESLPTEPGQLSLVDTREQELAVAVQNAVQKLNARVMDRVYGLRQRLAIVNGGEAIAERAIPGGPAWLGDAFRQAIGELELENRVRVVFVALFDKYVLARAETLFDEYNQRLIDADILPNLRYEVRKQPGSIEIVEQTVEPGAIGEHAQATAPPPETGTQTPSELGDELFDRICELMTVRRGGAPAAAATNRAPGMSVVGGKATAGDSEPGMSQAAEYGIVQTTLLPRLGQLQANISSATTIISSDEFIENIEVDENLIEQLQATLLEERNKVFGETDRRKIPVADTNVIELVGLLFEYMLKEEGLPNVVKALLSRLHTPLLKAAVIDRSFFTRSQHPARKLLNDMTAAGIRWVDEARPGHGVFPAMKEAVDRVLAEFDEDIGVLEEILADFSNVVSELEQRSSLVEKRSAEAANGQEKLQQAREHAARAIREVIGNSAIAVAAQHFLEHIWADRLTFVQLRSSDVETNPEWQHAIDMARDIVHHSTPPQNESERRERRETLSRHQQSVREAASVLAQPDKEKHLLDLFTTQNRLLEEPGLTGHSPVVEVAAAPPSEKPESAPPLSPEQQRMLHELGNVPFGTWFEFTEAGNRVRRVKLAWRSTVTGKFMFVDKMGVKAYVIDKADMVDSMIGGKVRMIHVDRKPFVDRAMKAIHRMLDHGARQTAEA